MICLLILKMQVIEISFHKYQLFFCSFVLLFDPSIVAIRNSKNHILILQSKKRTKKANHFLVRLTCGYTKISNSITSQTDENFLFQGAYLNHDWSVCFIRDRAVQIWYPKGTGIRRNW